MSDFVSPSPEENFNPSVVMYRLRELGRSVRELIEWRRTVDEERTNLRNTAKTLADEMVEVKKSLDTLRKTIVGFALTIAVSAVTFALTVLIATGKIGGK